VFAGGVSYAGTTPFRVYNVRHRVKVYARMGKKTVIEHGGIPYEAAEKAKSRLMSKQV
jgi:hypothetical protein